MTLVQTLMRRRLLLDIGQVWMAAMVANILLYLFQLMAGRGLEPSDYGLFGALFGIIYLSGALASGIQLSMAKIVADWRGSDRQAYTSLLVTSALLQVALVGGAILLLFSLASPWIISFLRGAAPTPVLIAGITVFLILIWAVPQGAIQGQERFLWLSSISVVNAAARLVLGLGALVLGLGISGVLSAVGLAALVAIAVSMLVVRPSSTVSLKALPMRTASGVLAPILIGTVAMNFVTSADVVIVRHLLPSVDAGLYAGAATLGRIVLFLSGAISLVLFPKMSYHWSMGRSPRGLLYKGLGVTALLSGAATLGFVLFPGLALTVLLGSEYAGAREVVPVYAAAMFSFALTTVFLYYHLATGRTSYLYVLLPHILAPLALVYTFHDSLTQVAWVVLGANVSLLASSFLFTRVTGSQEARNTKLLIASAGAVRSNPAQ